MATSPPVPVDDDVKTTQDEAEDPKKKANPKGWVTCGVMRQASLMQNCGWMMLDVEVYLTPGIFCWEDFLLESQNWGDTCNDM